MKHLIKCLVLILLLLLVHIHAQPQGEDEPVKDDSRSVELPEKEIIKDIRVGTKKRSILNRSKQGIEDIEITYKENFVIFEFFLSDKYDEKEIKYWYKLESFDLEWMQAKANRPFAAYSLLEPGTYVFKVKRSLVIEGEITKTVEESVKMTITPRLKK